jgi:hypothetical protein
MLRSLQLLKRCPKEWRRRCWLACYSFPQPAKLLGNAVGKSPAYRLAVLGFCG